jgi:hypothetical protein
MVATAFYSQPGHFWMPGRGRDFDESLEFGGSKSKRLRLSTKNTKK